MNSFLKLIVPIRLLLLLIGTGSAETVIYGEVKIYNFTLTSDRDPRQYLAQFANHTDVRFIQPVWPVMTAEMLRQLTKARGFLCAIGEMPTFHVIPQLQVLKLDACQTTNLVINSGYKYDLDWLTVDHGKLGRIPPNLNSLTKLRELKLRNCSIEYLNMNDFRGLIKLTILDLIHNKIARVSSSLDQPVHLPSLELLCLQFNQLTELCFENWKAPALHWVELQNNSLTMVHSLDRLPALDGILLHNNPFNCGWLHQSLHQLKTRDVNVIAAENVTCSL